MPPAVCLVALLLAVLVSPAAAQRTDAPPPQRPSREWTLEEAVAAALAQHPLVEAAVGRLEAARGERDSTAALPNPVGTFWMENAGYPGQDAAPNLARETSIYLTYPLEALFQRAPRVRRSDEEIEAAESLVRLARRRIAADTVGAFFAVALAQVLHDEALENRDRFDQLVAYNRARVEEGITAERELLRLQVELDRATNDVVLAEVESIRARARLAWASIEIIDGRKRFPVIVRLGAAYRGTPEAIGHLMMTTPSGGKVLLSQVARVQVVEGPELINHENGERMVIVQSNVRGRDLGGFAADVQRAVAARVVLPEGYFVTYGGQFENQQRAMARLAVIVPLVLGLIVALLYASFGNGRQALLVMLNVPFALVGGIGALWLRGLNLNLSASVGFIALFGIAVLNGVVLISYLNQLRDEGKPLQQAVREGSEIRLRPVLMTALVASFGFVPMAVSTSPGSEVQRPLATVVIGGLLVAPSPSTDHVDRSAPPRSAA